MSRARECNALNHSASLFEFAQRLYRLALDGPLPVEDRRIPGGSPCPRKPCRERKAALAAVLREFLNNPALTARDLRDRRAGLAASSGDVCLVLRELAPAPSLRELLPGDLARQIAEMHRFPTARPGPIRKRSGTLWSGCPPFAARG